MPTVLRVILPRADGAAEGAGQQRRGVEHLRENRGQERFAHPHEDGAGDSSALVVGDLSGVGPLVENLPGGQVATGRHPGGGAEGAAHRAADLRRKADADGAGFVQGDEHRLDRQAVAGAKQQFLEPVDGRRDRAFESQTRQGVTDPGNRALGNLKVAGPDRWVIPSPGDDGGDQPAADPGDEAEGGDVGQGGVGRLVAGVEWFVG